MVKNEIEVEFKEPYVCVVARVSLFMAKGKEEVYIHLKRQGIEYSQSAQHQESLLNDINPS